MGNCQATDVVAAAIIQHPNGSLEKLYWPTTAGEVMRSHPGLHLALLTFHISGHVLNTYDTKRDASGGVGSLRLIHARLLKHNDLLLIGQVYRLVTSQEVARALQARKQKRHRKAQAELMKQQEHKQRQQQSTGADGRDQAIKNEKERPRNSHQWRPSLQSISEAGIE